MNMTKATETKDKIYSLVREQQLNRYAGQDQGEDLKTLPILWKYDKELGAAFFCPHCKVFQCSGSGACTECDGDINWDALTARFILNGNRIVCDFDSVYPNECEVIGNIFDNPELLEVESE